MKKRHSVLWSNCLLAATTIVVLAILLSCEVFMPNFLIGTWFASGPNGNEKLVFTKEGDFTAQFYQDGKAQKRAGKYKAGKSVVQLSYKNEAGKHVKSVAPYKMYSRSMDFIMKGKKTRFYKF